MTEQTQDLSPETPLRVLVTGAAGGIGAHVVHELLTHGHMVRATDIVSLPQARRDLRELIEAHREDDALEWRRLDLTRCSEPGLRRLIEGCDAIIHTAAMVSLTEEYEDFAPLNVDVTRALFLLGSELGVRRFVHFSCGTLYAQKRGTLTEDSTIQTTNGYEESKLAAEQIFTARATETTCDWTILRPGLVYGPGCRTMSASAVTLPPIFRNFIRYLPGLTGGPRTNWCHAEDAASAARFVMEHDDTPGRTLNVGDGTPLAFGEVMTSITEAYGLELGMLFSFPGTAAQTLLNPFVNRDVIFDSTRQVLRQLWKRIQQDHDLRSPLRPRLDRKALIYAAEDAIVDSSALRALGWTPRWDDFREGIIETIRWYQDHGWVPRYDTQTLLEQEADRFERAFSVNELLEGRWTDAEGTTHPMRLDLDVEFPPLRPFARVRGNLDGTITLRALGEGPLQGTIDVDLAPGGAVTYEFGFRINGTGYRFSGQKEIDWRAPLHSVSNLSGEMIDERGEALGEAVLTFEPSQRVLPLLVSMRFLRRVRDAAQGATQ